MLLLQLGTKLDMPLSPVQILVALRHLGLKPEGNRLDSSLPLPALGAVGADVNSIASRQRPGQGKSWLPQAARSRRRVSEEERYPVQLAS